MESKLLFVATILLLLGASIDAKRMKRDVFDYKSSSSATTGVKRDITQLVNRQMNVDCSAAEPLTLGAGPTGVFDTASSFFYFFEQPHIIDAVTFKSVATPYGSGYWFSFEGTGGAVEIDTCNGVPTSARITINVWKSMESDCSDIGYAVAGTSYQPEGVCYASNPIVSVCTEVGATYKVYIAADRSGGTYKVSARSAGSCAAPSNSKKEDAIAIELNRRGEATIVGNNMGAPIQQLPCCNVQGICFTQNALVAATWYKFVGTGAVMTAEISVENSRVFDLDTAIAVYSENSVFGLACEIGQDDEIYSEIYQPKITFAPEKGQTVYIAVSTFEGSKGGNFTMQVKSRSGSSGGDDCEVKNKAPIIEGVKLEKITKNNEIVISYDLEDDNISNNVNLYVLISGKWVLVKSGLSGDIGKDIEIDGERKEFSWHGALSGEYFILLKASDEQFQSASEPLFIHVSWGPDGEVYEAKCPDNYPYIPFEKVITWVNKRGEVTLEDGRRVVYSQMPTECSN